MKVKVKADGSVADVDATIKAVNKKAGALLIGGKALNSKDSLIEAGIRDLTLITASTGVSIAYKEKRDLLI